MATAIASNRASNASARRKTPAGRSACHGAHCGEGPVLAMLAVLRVAPLLPSATPRAVAGDARSGRESRLIVFEQSQVMQRVEDEVLALVGARMTGDHLGPAGDHHLMDVAADQNLAVAVGSRYRVVGAAIAHQR